MASTANGDNAAVQAKADRAERRRVSGGTPQAKSLEPEDKADEGPAPDNYNWALYSAHSRRGRRQ